MSAKPKQIFSSLHWYDARIHLGVLDSARTHGWLVLGAEHGYELPSNVSPDGVIASVGLSKHRLRRVQSFGVPFVLVGDNALGVQVPCVMPDYVRIGGMAAEFFAQRGFRHFTFVYPHPSRLHPWHQERLDGSRAGVTAANGTLHCLLRPTADAGRSERHENRAKVRWMCRVLRAAAGGASSRLLVRQLLLRDLALDLLVLGILMHKRRLSLLRQGRNGAVGEGHSACCLDLADGPDPLLVYWLLLNGQIVDELKTLKSNFLALLSPGYVE